jgi:hypothetical protein
MKKLVRFFYCMYHHLDYRACHCEVGDAMEDNEMEMQGPCPGCGYQL